MIRIDNSDEFERIISSMTLHLKNLETIFENETNNMERINETEIWTGETQREIYNKYQELTKNYPPILEGVKTYINLMQKTIDDYKKLDTYRDNVANENSTELDVNS